MTTATAAATPSTTTRSQKGRTDTATIDPAAPASAGSDARYDPPGVTAASATPSTASSPNAPIASDQAPIGRRSRPYQASTIVTTIATTHARNHPGHHGSIMFVYPGRNATSSAHSSCAATGARIKGTTARPSPAAVRGQLVSPRRRARKASPSTASTAMIASGQTNQPGYRNSTLRTGK